jgi:outer membrane protein assembly factor BamB
MMNYRFKLSLLLLFIGCAVNFGLSPVHAFLDKELKIYGSDAMPSGDFGIAVAIAGDIAIVGARGNDKLESNAGLAFLFDARTGKEVRQLRASDAGDNGQFGTSVDVEGQFAIVGAQVYHDAIQSGAAYVFDTATGNQLFKLKADDASWAQNFGGAVGISGNVAVIGAYGDNETGAFAGSAYLFDLTTGQQLFKLNADSGPNDFFGSAADIDANVAIIGGPYHDAHGADAGAAYLFDVTNGQLLHKLVPDDVKAGDVFGATVAIHGNFAVVSSPSSGENGIRSGSVYVFDVLTGDQILKIRANDPSVGDRFGSVAIDGELIIVGAGGVDDGGDGSGAAYLFDLKTGAQLMKLTADDAAAGATFGNAVGISGRRAIVGAFEDRELGYGAGAAYIYVPEPTALLLTLCALSCVSFSRSTRD